MREQNRNLAIRIATALVLFPFAVWVTWLGGLAFTLLVAVVAAISATELVLMFERRMRATGLLGVAGAALLPLVVWHASRGGGAPPPGWVGLAVAFASIALLVTAMLQGGPLEEAPRSAAMSALAWAYAGVLPASVVWVRLHYGWQWVILLFVVGWGNDTLAYFAGRFLGRHKLAERISPKKTWEGVAGGTAGSLAGAFAVKALFLPALHPVACVAVGLGGAVLAPLGDLSESMLKRAAGVKDSGRLVPGHGGLLDRIDAVLFVAPWIGACALWWLR
ncbi:MAG TPA: phosphatidate cytidylyltransferase [Anaeromyxobacteraceae bacterium]|nr:phosphatidate cytidylyltransferase [Anaeromyxobacteraceae bacterium]